MSQYILPQPNDVNHAPSLDSDFVQATCPASNVALPHLASKHPAIHFLIQRWGSAVGSESCISGPRDVPTRSEPTASISLASPLVVSHRLRLLRVPTPSLKQDRRFPSNRMFSDPAAFGQLVSSASHLRRPLSSYQAIKIASI